MTTPLPLLVRRPTGRWTVSCCPALAPSPSRRVRVRSVVVRYRHIVGYRTRRRAATVLARHLAVEHRLVIAPWRIAAHTEEACQACAGGLSVDDYGNPIPCWICEDIDYEQVLIALDDGLDSWEPTR